MLDAEVMLELGRLAERAAGGAVLDSVLAELAVLAGQAADAQASVLLSEAQGLRAVGLAVPGPGGAAAEVRERGPVARSLLSQELVEADDLTDRGRWPGLAGPARKAGMLAALAAPIVCDDQVWGAVELRRREPGGWSRDERAAARLCAGLAATWLRMAAVRDALDTLPAATTAPVEALPARGRVSSNVEHALAVARRQGSRAGLMLVRLDCWTGAEQVLGLPGARQVLVDARERIRSSMRGSDAITPLAEDLLAVVCEDLRDDHHRAEEQLQAIGVRFAGAVTVEPHGGISWRQVATTIGAVTSAGGSPSTEVVRAASDALDVARRRGRGRFVVADLA